jgi:aminoglycoside 3-N-acetyltransferase I
MNMEIKKLTHQDIDEFIALIRVFEEVFEMENFVMPHQEHLRKVLLKPDFIVFVAIMDDQVIGGLTTYVLEQYYAEKPLAYIYDLAVKANYQRQGIGKQLIAGVTNYCREKGFEEVFVQADKVDDYALDFYRSTGVTAEEQVVHFYYTLHS